jgi:ATP-dependent Clp protease ATP-binding subunit ClpC
VQVGLRKRFSQPRKRINMMSFKATPRTMFERFTEEARRVLFFARAKTTERDGDAIIEQDLLGGIVLVKPQIFSRFAKPLTGMLTESAHDFISRLVEDRSSWEARAAKEIRFSAAVQMTLTRAGEEADQLGHDAIQPEHLLLGILRDDSSDVSRTLNDAGVTLHEARRIMGTDLNGQS